MDFHSHEFWGSVFGMVIFTFIGNLLLKKFKERGVPTYRFGGYVCYGVAAGYVVHLLYEFAKG